MPVIDPTLTLAELVTVDPGAAAVLDRLGLDYCCGGHRSLADAADQAGTPVAEIVAALASAPAGPAPGWTELGPADLVDHIVSVHHAYLDEALPRLDALATKVAGVHGERHPELRQVRRLVVELRADLAPHMRREEQVLFPAIRAAAAGGSGSRLPRATLRTAIGVMEGEHDHTGELLATLRATAGGYHVPDDGCASYRALYAGLAELEADTHEHVHKENNVLFPAVLATDGAP